tara:strand:+ start:2364 stop:2582 length:219 start_codon:yes stop_codon:yes gene_type:complete
MKIYIARYTTDDHCDVMAYSSMKAMRKDIADFQDVDHDADFSRAEVDSYVTEVHPTRRGIIEFFNREAWHNQ